MSRRRAEPLDMAVTVDGGWGTDHATKPGEDQRRLTIRVMDATNRGTILEVTLNASAALDLLTNRSDSTQVPSPARFYGVDHVGKVWQRAVVVVPMGEWGDMAAIAAGISPSITEAGWSWQEEASGWNGHRVVRQGDGRDGYRVTLGRYADPDGPADAEPSLQQLVDWWQPEAARRLQLQVVGPDTQDPGLCEHGRPVGLCARCTWLEDHPDDDLDDEGVAP